MHNPLTPLHVSGIFAIVALHLSPHRPLRAQWREAQKLDMHVSSHIQLREDRNRPRSDRDVDDGHVRGHLERGHGSLRDGVDERLEIEQAGISYSTDRALTAEAIWEYALERLVNAPVVRSLAA